MKTAVFWGGVAGFVLGIIIRSLVPLGWSLALCVLLIGACVALVSRATAGAFFAAVLIMCGAGIVRMHAAAPVPDALLEGVLGSEVVLEGIVDREPDAREHSLRLFVQADTLLSDKGARIVEGGVLAILPLHAEGEYGDRVRVSGVLRAPEAFEGSGGREFDYPGYLVSQGILYELAFADSRVLKERAGGHLVVGVALALKHAFVEGLGRVLPEPHAGLAAGITVGDKRGLGEKLGDVFKQVGLTHIIVLSGYNIVIVMDALARLLSRAPRFLRFGSGIASAALFALMTGLAAASVRAAAMALVAMLGKATGRIYLASRALSFVALGMLLWNPHLLLFDPGFQLSIVATWGLIALSPHVERVFGFVTPRFGLREIVVSSLSAQTAVLPLILYQTGSLSLAALPANLFVLVATPAAMAASAVAGVAGFAFGSVALPLAFPAYALLSYIITTAETLAGLPLATVPVPVFGVSVLFALYATLVAGLLIARARQGSAVPQRSS